ncbi:uncharacterized protein LOC111021825 [Momordica charantia]|uniref:Uncharacterized protein LOC111021825 n=1 Tax=Momordica charantia TaxID=3673 RepID=A0A6J1DKR2_MOMCH|nr:uncharacterized protein LOC111021825 [Momordica charantia]
MPGIDPSIIVHRLRVDPSYRPVRQKRRPFDAERSNVICKEVEQLLRANFIREVHYPAWPSNVVKKSNSKWRVCIDFMSLNKACPKNNFPLPRIDQLVDATAGHELLFFMDAYSEYNQIRMHAPDQEHTTFITDQGQYCYNVMPFGLKNAGTTYQRMVNMMFAKQIGRNMELYVDDMLVKSKQTSSHLADLAEAFSVLRKYWMKLNPSKCAFGVSSRKLLGFMVHERRIEANLNKIRAVFDMEAPRNIRQLQRLNGRLIALNRFARGDVRDQWTLYVDGSSNEKDCGAGMLLLGRCGLRFEYALRFDFRASNNEALINGLKVARGMGVKRLLILNDSQLIVPRSENFNTDALAHLAWAYETDLLRTIPVEILAESSIDQPEVMEARKLRRQATHYLMHEGKLFKRGYSLPLLRYLDPEEARYVICEIHEGVCRNHGGARSMAAKVVRQSYYWPTIERDTKEFTKTCDKCQHFASILRQPSEMLTLISSPWPFAQWGIDLIGPLPTANGQLKFAVVAVDYFTKWVEAEPLTSITEEKVVSFV